jgi:hypothetical protein
MYTIKNIIFATENCREESWIESATGYVGFTEKFSGSWLVP